MGRCAVPGCEIRSGYGKKVRLFAVPNIRYDVPLTSQERLLRRRHLWLSKIGKLHYLHSKKRVEVCSRHFIFGEYFISPLQKGLKGRDMWGLATCKVMSNTGVCERTIYVSFTGEPAKPTNETSPDWSPSLYLEQTDEANRHENAIRLADPESDRPGPANAHAEPESDSPSNIEDCELEGSDCVDNSFDAYFGADQDVANSTVLSDSAPPAFHELQADYNEVVKARAKLRDELTEAEVDILELSAAKSASDDKCEALTAKCEALDVESKLLKGQLEEYAGRVKKLEAQVADSDKKICALEVQLSSATRCTLTRELLQKDDSLVSYYTGLPSYSVFDAVLTLICTYFDDCCSTLQPWQCLLLTLMRLRLGLQVEDLAFRFGICKQTVSNIFGKWLYLLYVYLPCINWPDREVLYKTMPNSFKDAFGKSVCVIIDCFELFCERPGALDSRAMTWSNYKHHNTVKYLIGITPGGAISFLSQGWGGRVSDTHVTANSGLYEKLLPNDVILADRGFPIGEDVGFYCARVLMPAFTHGQAQLRSHDISDTRKLASLRVHVERAIGLVKNRYRILKTTLHHEFLNVKAGHTLAQIDEIVHVCCSQTNLSKGIMIQ